MGSKDLYAQLAHDVSRLESKIQQVYCYPDSYQKGEKFKAELFKIEEGLKINNSQGKPLDGIFPHEKSFITQLYDLEGQIDNFLAEQDLKDELIRRKNIFIDRVQTSVIGQISSLPTNQLWENLSQIINEWNFSESNEIEKGEFQRTVRATVLDLFISSAKQGEQINLNSASKFCSTDDLLKAIRAKLIDIAQTKDGNNKDKILFKARYLRPETIKEPDLWQILTDNPNVSVLGSIQELAPIRPKAVTPQSPNTTALAVIQPKPNLFKKLFHVKGKPKTTLYTFGDINPENGEWKNVKVVVDKFPKKLSKKQMNRLLALEINDVDTIDENNYSNYRHASNLQKIVFGRVRCISAIQKQHKPYESFSSSLCDFDDSLFSKNSSLSNVEISNNVQEISSYAFHDCKSLKEVNLPASITSLDWHTFSCCDNLSVFSAPGVRFIGFHCFSSCKSLVDFRFGENLKSIVKYAFAYCQSLLNVHLPESTTCIGANAFCACTSLQSIYFPDSVEDIPQACCSGCTNLTDVQLGKNLKSIGSYAFNNCTALEHIDFPEKTSEIGMKAFNGCESLTDVTFDKETEFILTDDNKELEIKDTKSLKEHIFTRCLKLKIRHREKRKSKEPQTAENAHETTHIAQPKEETYSNAGTTSSWNPYLEDDGR